MIKIEIFHNGTKGGYFMDKKCWILFFLCIFSGFAEVLLKILEIEHMDIISVMICSFGLLCFVLFLIALQQAKKTK